MKRNRKFLSCCIFQLCSEGGVAHLRLNFPTCHISDFFLLYAYLQKKWEGDGISPTFLYYSKNYSYSSSPSSSYSSSPSSSYSSFPSSYSYSSSSSYSSSYSSSSSFSSSFSSSSSYSSSFSSSSTLPPPPPPPSPSPLTFGHMTCTFFFLEICTVLYFGDVPT